MVIDDISHHPDVTLVAFRYKFVQILIGAEEFVMRIQVCETVPMVRICAIFRLLWRWGNPNGVVPEFFDVVKLTNHPFVCPATVFVEVAAVRDRLVVSGEAVGHRLVDASVAPQIGPGI